jgi:glucosyl-dolichyl phosphate glucuronosyltransferase
MEEQRSLTGCSDSRMPGSVGDTALAEPATRSTRLDVIIPTFNREQLLERALLSLLAAEVPCGLDVHVTVVDNNSTDGTRALVERYLSSFDGRLQYLFESRPGRSAALNAGIAATSGDLVGMIDDDEEIDSRWFVSIRDAFSAGDVDFIGGPYIPRWGADPPDWLPEEYPAVIGRIEARDRVLDFDGEYDGILMGGNAVLTRQILSKVGPYPTTLGRTRSRLLSGEDDEMYQRLRTVGARGKCLPHLVIYHYIPPERLTKRYHRSWCFWHGVSMAVVDRDRRQPVPYVAGIPRYLFGQAARRLWRVATARFRGATPAQRFSDELAAWDLLGFAYGKWFRRLAGGQD